MPGAGLTGATVRVARALLSGGPQTATALAEALHLTSTAIRRHLEALVRDGHAIASQRAPYGPAARQTQRGRGRPAKVFTITQAGRDALAAYTQSNGAYDEVARDVLHYLRKVSGDDAVADFALERARTSVKSYADRINAPLHSVGRVEELARELTEDGFSASLTNVTPGGVQLCQHSCPVAHVAEDFPVLCEAETRAFSELLGVNVTRLATIAKGAGICTTHIPVSASAAVTPATSTPGIQEDRS